MQYSEEEYYHKADNLIRISCQAVQEVFRNIWKGLTGSEWTTGCANDFIKGDGKGLYSKSQPIQKQLLEEGDLEKWDLSLLFGIFNLKCFGAQEDDEAWKLKKAALQNLCATRNQLAHNAQKKISAIAYQEVEAGVRDSLSALGVNKNKIKKWISNAGVTSSVAALEQAKEIQKQADEEFAKGNYRESLKLYDDALLVPSLLPRNLCTLYEQRAVCYLELGLREKDEKSQNGIYDLAVKDVEEALSHNESSWKAYSTLGKIHKAKHDLDKAIQHLEKAFAMCPAQTGIKEELDDCKLLRGSIFREDHMEPKLMPRTLEELVQQYSQMAGRNVTAEMFLKNYMEIGDEFLPGQGDVYTGHRYVNGWKVEQNYQEAARNYTKAMTKGNAEGIYSLASLYMKGTGVRKDIPYAIELLNKAANMPEKIKYRGFWHPDPGVQAAQHALGLRYHEGVGVSQDYVEAAKWFEKAANNGSEYAANNLAILYYDGRGVEKDLKMAEMYWKKSAEAGSIQAAQSLCHYYIGELEPELATLWLEKAIQLGHNRMSSLREGFLFYIARAAKRREQSEEEVNKFEEEYGLSKLGLTFGQRMARMGVAALHQMTLDEAGAKDSKTAEKEATENAETFAKFWESNPFSIDDKHVRTKLGWAGKIKSTIDCEHIDVIYERSNAGSITAQRILTVLGCNGCLLELWDTGPPFAEELTKQIIELIYQISCLEHHLLRFSSLEMKYQFRRFLASQFDAHGSNRGDLDRKIRLCYAIHGTDGDYQFRILILKEGLRRYPNEGSYYEMLACLYTLTKEHHKGLEVVNQGLARFPNQLDLLYYKAFHTQPTGGNIEETYQAKINVYLEFLKVAPEDHRKVPEAYYCIAQSYLPILVPGGQLLLNEKGRFAQKQILDYYEMAKRAEEKQLPFYLPYESPIKGFLAPMVAMIKKVRFNQPGTSSAAKTGGKKSQPLKTSVTTLPEFLKDTSRHYLKDPKRIEIRKAHRSIIYEHWKNDYVAVAGATSIPALRQNFPKKLVGLKEVFLREMDPCQDKVYENTILNLTLIEDPIIGFFTSIQLVAMDDNKDTIRLFIYNVPHGEEMRKQLGFGCRLSVINPYVRVARDQNNGIRVDEPRCIIYMEKVENMCRYCGKENATKNCAKCKWARYCDRECQVADWKELQHKLICKP